MGDRGGSPVPGEEGTTEGSTLPAILDPVILRFAVLTYLAVLPVGHLVAIPVNGMMARGTDVFLALVLLAGIIDIGRMMGPYLTGGGGPLFPGRRASYIVALFIVGFSGWVALSAAWILNPAYALTKGLAFVGLGMGALAILWCGAPPSPGRWWDCWCTTTHPPTSSWGTATRSSSAWCSPASRFRPHPVCPVAFLPLSSCLRSYSRCPSSTPPS
jgi:hypothetical protein